MREILQKLLHRAAEYLEIIVALVITIVILILIVFMVIGLCTHPEALHESDAMNLFLNNAFTLIIGIEFLKMVVKPTPSNIVETLIFAVSRQIVLDHDMGVTMAGIVCIALLFLTKKYLFSHFDESEKICYRASARIALVNRVSRLNLPQTYGATLGELMQAELKKSGKAANVGAAVEVDGTALRVDKLGREGNISRIQVIKELT